MKCTLEDMAARILRFTPAEALELAEAFAGLSKANGSNSELLTHRKTPEAALIDIGAGALRELAACRQALDERTDCGWINDTQEDAFNRRVAEIMAANAQGERRTEGVRSTAWLAGKQIYP